MNNRKILENLETIAEKFDLEIKYDFFEGKGGLCNFKGKQFFLINKNLPPQEKAKVIAYGLNNFSLENISILPMIRQFIEKEKEKEIEN